MGYNLLSLLVLILWIVAIVDCAKSNNPNKVVWIIVIILVSLLPAAWTFYSLRKLASIHYRLAGGLALLSAASIGALWLRLYEVNDSIIHVVEWHYLPMLFIGFIGLWLGEIILKW